jgi:hypothetical protein
MQPLELTLTIRKQIEQSGHSFRGSDCHFRAISIQPIYVLAESDLDRVCLQDTIHDHTGVAYVLVGTSTVSGHMLLHLVPIPGDPAQEVL